MSAARPGSRSLFRFARDADARPWDGVETRLGNRLAAVAANAVGALLNALERLFDRLQNFGVGLLELQLDVDLVVARRLVGEVSLTRVRVKRHGQRITATAGEDVSPFPQQHLFEGRYVHWQLDILTIRHAAPQAACVSGHLRSPRRR